MFVKIDPNRCRIFGLLFQGDFSPSIFKSSPIWSHCNRELGCQEFKFLNGPKFKMAQVTDVTKSSKSRQFEGHTRPLFRYFHRVNTNSKQKTNDTIANALVWNRTVDLWCTNRPLCPLCPSQCAQRLSANKHSDISIYDSKSF